MNMTVTIPSIVNSSTKALGLNTNILIIGGSYAGVSALGTLCQQLQGRKLPEPLVNSKISITLIEPRTGLYNVLGASRSTTDPKFAESQWIPYSQFRNIKFDNIISPEQKIIDEITQSGSNANSNITVNYVQGNVNYLDSKTAKYSLVDANGEQQEINYDFAVLATGKHRGWPITPESNTYSSFIEEMKKVNKKFDEHKTVSIIGAGAVGIELAGDLKHYHKNLVVNLIHPHPMFPPEPLSDDFKKATMKSLVDADVKVYTNTRIKEELPNGDLVTTDGLTIESDMAVWCTSQKNNVGFLSKDIQEKFLTEKKNLKTTQFFNLSNGADEYKNIFVVGDLIDTPFIKSAGAAMFTGRAAALNVLSGVYGQAYEATLPGRMGNKMALVAGNGDVVVEQGGRMSVNHPKYVQEYKDYRFSSVLDKLRP